LEINPNCGIFYPAPPDQPDALGSADFILLHDPMGHVGFIEHIMQAAIERQNVVQERPKFGSNQIRVTACTQKWTFPWAN